MKFLVQEILKITWYYSPLEVTKEINKNRKNTNLEPLEQSIVLNHISYLQQAQKYLNLEKPVGYYYEPKESIRKQALSFHVNPENKELITEQIQGLFDYMIDNMSQNIFLSEGDIANHATYLENYFNKRKMSEYLDQKYPEKEKASIKKPKI